MVMKRNVLQSRAFLAFAAIVILSVGFIAGTRSNDILAVAGPLVGIKTASGELDDSSLQDTFRTLKAYYNGSLDEKKLLDGAKKGMVAATGDPYTMFMTAKEAEEFNKELNGQIGGGIGAEVGIRNNQPTIIRTLRDNPAEKVGLHAGDVILSVNGESVNGWDAERTVTVIKGEVGTSVKILVKRGAENKEFSITRAVINNPSVSSELRGTTGILTLNRFDQETVALVRKEVSALKGKGMTQLVLDMRGNGGGVLDAAPGVVGMWVDGKPTVSIKANNGGSTVLNADGEQLLKGFKTAVLVNGSTASASEIVTAALQHYKVATVVGEKTFGKGTVQELVPLEGGAMLKVTIQRWYTPSGANVNGKGIKPDVEVGLTQDQLNAGKDPQLEKAIELAGTR